MRAGLILLISIFALIISANIMAETVAQDDDTDAELSPKEVFAKIPSLYDDLISKMKKREVSMTKIIIALPRGGFDVIKTEAEKINNEYSIEYNMDPDVQAEYSSMITTEFIFADQDLMQYTDALVSASEEKYLEGVLIQFDQVMRSCVACHYSFAKEKFPDLARSLTEI